MRALIITDFPPMVKAFEERGNFRRFSLFMGAIREITDRVDILHLWPTKDNDIQRFDAEQSERFNMDVSTHVIQMESQRHTLISNYLLGSLSARYQTQYFPNCSKTHVAKVRQLLGSSPDFVFVHRLSGMLPVLHSGYRPKRMYFDLDDLEHSKRVQTAFEQRTWTRKLARLALVPAVVAAERKAAALSQVTFVCSEIDRSRLEKLGAGRVSIVQNAVVLPSQVAPLPKKPTILFLGFNYYKANADAAERLVKNIFPRIRARVPMAELVIAGSGTMALPFCREAPEGVKCLGYVDDLSKLYESTRLICCPVTYGTGTRMKLIEAAAHGRPMVATNLAAEGLAFRDGSEILLCEDDGAIASACVRLMVDDSFANGLAWAARRQTELTYNDEVVRKTIVQALAGA